MSNVNDPDYMNEVTAQLYDAKGNKITGSYDYEITTKNAENFVRVDSTNKFTAYNAAAKTYTIKVTGAQADGNGDGRTFVKNVNVVVKALKNYNEKTGKFENLDLTYQIEMNTNTLDENPQKDEKKTLESRLYATSNGLFAGYVRNPGSEITVAEGNVTASASTELADVNVLAKFGTKYYAPGALYNAAAVSGNSAGYPISNGKNTFNTVTDASSVVWKANNKSDDLAKTGAWTLEYKLAYTKDNGDATKIVTKSNAFTVKNTVTIPTVTVLSRNVDGLDFGSIVENLKTNVDMNNNTSSHESFDTLVYTESGTNKWIVKEAVVRDNYGAQDWYFYVPLNTTFTLN